MWCFGLNVHGKGGVHYLHGADSGREVRHHTWSLGCNSNALPALMDALQDVFYVSGQVGVVYDRTSNEQHLLQGHRHAIVASAVRCVFVLIPSMSMFF